MSALLLPACSLPLEHAVCWRHRRCGAVMGNVRLVPGISGLRVHDTTGFLPMQLVQGQVYHQSGW